MRKNIWIMPEEKDEKFSLALIERVCLFAKNFGITAFELEIKEQYVTEITPHYHFYVGFGLCLDLPSTEISAIYTASANDEQYQGLMNMIFRANRGWGNVHQFITTGAFFLYDEFIRQFYPEWETTYKEIRLPK